MGFLGKTKGFIESLTLIEPKGSRRDFEGALPGQKACVCALMQATEGLKVGCGGMGGFKEWADGRV